MKESTENIIAAQIGSARLSTYLTQAQGDRSRALALYLWNLESSAAVLSTTAMVEVHLRNTVDLALKSWNAAQDYTAEPGREGPYSQEWIEDPAPRIRNIVAPARRVSLKDKSRSSMKDINNKNTKPYPTHDDYVAGLTFGTWTSLLPHPDAGSNNIRVAIWETELSKYFLSTATLCITGLSICDMREIELRTLSLYSMSGNFSTITGAQYVCSMRLIQSRRPG